MRPLWAGCRLCFIRKLVFQNQISQFIPRVGLGCHDCLVLAGGLCSGALRGSAGAVAGRPVYGRYQYPCSLFWHGQARLNGCLLWRFCWMIWRRPLPQWCLSPLYRYWWTEIIPLRNMRFWPLSTLGRTLLASSSGELVDWLNGDWGLFFIITAAMVGPSLFLLWWMRGTLSSLDKNRDKNNTARLWHSYPAISKADQPDMAGRRAMCCFNTPDCFFNRLYCDAAMMGIGMQDICCVQTHPDMPVPKIISPR